MKTVVVRNIKRADADVVKRLGALGTSTVHEAYGRFGLMKTYMRPVWAGGKAAGTAVTVLAQPGDNWMLHVAVEQCRPGDMLVVAPTSSSAVTSVPRIVRMRATVMFSSWPLSALVAGLKIGGSSRPLSARPACSFSPASVPCFAYSRHAEPDR